MSPMTTPPSSTSAEQRRSERNDLLFVLMANNTLNRLDFIKESLTSNGQEASNIFILLRQSVLPLKTNIIVRGKSSVNSARHLTVLLSLTILFSRFSIIY